ncbi:MAG: biotin/lipoyl-binding protein [Thiolinea sp.]
MPALPCAHGGDRSGRHNDTRRHPVACAHECDTHHQRARLRYQLAGLAGQRREIAANIASISVDVGDSVKKGAQLAQLDCREYTIREEQAKADISSLQARLPAIEARIEAAKNDVAANENSIGLLDTQAKAAQAGASAAQADVGRIQAQRQAEQARCELAGLDLKRARDLRQRQVISQQELDQAATTQRAALAACNAVQPELNSAAAKTQAAQAAAQAAQVAVKVQQAKTRMAYSNIQVIEAEIPALNTDCRRQAKLKTEQLMVSRCSLHALRGRDCRAYGANRAAHRYR